MWPSDCGVDHQRHVKAAAHLGDGRGRLDHAAVTGQRREVHQGRRVGGQHSGRLVDDQPAVAVGRQRAHVEAVRGHYRQVGAVLAGQAGHGAAARPAAEQQVQGVGGPGGEDDVGAVPISAATTARLASSTGAAASAATYPPTSVRAGRVGRRRR